MITVPGQASALESAVRPAHSISAAPAFLTAPDSGRFPWARPDAPALEYSVGVLDQIAFHCRYGLEK